MHPSSGEKVFVILDPCHMLKLARNALLMYFLNRSLKVMETKSTGILLNNTSRTKEIESSEQAVFQPLKI